MKTPYSFVTLRYVHDVITGEFANVGVVLYAPGERFLQARFSSSYERLNAIFLKIDHTHFRGLMRYFHHRFEALGEELRDSLSPLPVNRIGELVRRELPSDDSSLQWSESGGGFAENLPVTLQQLYARLVERYIKEGELNSRTDEDIAKPFRAELERRKLGARVQEKKIETADYQYDFRFAWQNSIWHLYEPVSFDLVDPKSIVEKATRWLGRGVTLHESTEPFQIYFLLGEPKGSGTRKAFESAKHLLEKIPGRPRLVGEEDMSTFAESVAREITGHDEQQGH